MSLLLPLTHWHWLGLALALFIFELLSSTTYFLWIGIGAAVTGLVLLILPTLHWSVQCLLFVFFSSLCIISGIRYLKSQHRVSKDYEALNQRNKQYISQIFTLVEATENKRSKVLVEDSIWQVSCTQDLPAHAKVKVIDADGTTLIVEPIND